MGRRANGEGSVHQRGDGRWAASISIGRLKRKHFLGKTRAEVAAKLTEALNDQNKGIPVISNKQSVAQYLTYWLDSTKASVRPKTHESLRPERPAADAADRQEPSQRLVTRHGGASLRGA